MVCGLRCVVCAVCGVWSAQCTVWGLRSGRRRGRVCLGEGMRVGLGVGVGVAMGVSLGVPGELGDSC